MNILEAMEILSNHITMLDAQGVLLDGELEEMQAAESMIYAYIKEKEADNYAYRNDQRCNRL